MARHDARGEKPVREVTGRFVLLCLLGFFGLVFGVNAVMVTAAVSTFGGVETANAYKAGLAFAHEEAAASEQDRRGWHVNAHIAPRRDGVVRIDMSATDAQNRPLSGLEAAITLVHPTNRRLDHALTVHAAGVGRFQGAATPDPGQWDLVIELTRDGERMFRSRRRVSLR